MVIALAAVTGTLVLLLFAGLITGRVRISSCCAPADPGRDVRMRGAVPGINVADTDAHCPGRRMGGPGQASQN